MPTDFRLYKQYDAKFDGSKKCPSDGFCPFTLNGETIPCAEEYPYIEGVYDVVANRDSDGNIVSYPTITLYHNKPNPNIFIMKVDDKPAQTLSATYTFDSEGEHVVRFYSKVKITSIVQGVFLQLKNVVTLRHIDDVTTIDIQAFRELEIKEFIIPKGIKVIPRETFYKTTRLKKIVIPDTVMELGNQSFYGMRGAEEVYVCATTPPICYPTNVFNGASNFPIYVPPESVNAYKAASGWSLYASRIKPMPKKMCES